MEIQSSLRTILQEFGSHYKKCLAKEWPVARDQAKTLRVSGFPYCGLRHWYTNTIQVGSSVSFAGSYYTGVGTLAHAIIQGWIGEGRRMYGNWKCKAEGCAGERKFDNRSTCPVCHSPMEYVEFEVHAFRYITGHIDGLYKATDGTWWIIDYKTSSTRNIEEHRKSTEPIFPYKKNKWQIRAYVVLLERELKIKIRGWMLFYIARDDPMNTFEVVGGVMKDETKTGYFDLMAVWDRHFSIVQNVGRAKRPKLEDIKILVEEKPCCDDADYQRVYGDPYNGCPLAGGGTCFDKKKLNRTLKETWNEWCT